MRCHKSLFLAAIALPALALSIMLGRFNDADLRFDVDSDEIEAELTERNA